MKQRKENGSGVSSQVKHDEYGLEIQNLSTKLRSQLRLGKRGGVLISQVLPNSVAEEAGLRAGQVI